MNPVEFTVELENVFYVCKVLLGG